MKILIVDDIFLNRYIMKEIVLKLGHEFVEADNGMKALNCFRDDNFDIIFLDIEMPVMNGLETAHQIRTAFKEPKNKVPIYALTAFSISVIQNELNLSDFDGVINKPYSDEKISNLLSTLR